MVVKKFAELLGLGVLVVGLGLTLGTWMVTSRMVGDQVAAEQMRGVELMEEKLKLVVEHYEVVLSGVKGLFAASVEVERDDFSDYFNEVDMLGQYPGVYSFTYVSRVQDGDARDFLAGLRQELSEAGLAGQVREELADTPEHYLINYVAYVHELPPVAYGLDLQVDEVRRKVLERARDTGKMTASGPIVIVGPESPGFILSLPIYRNGVAKGTVEERRQALAGWVNAVVLYKDLFERVLAPTEQMEVHVSEGGQLIYDADRDDGYHWHRNLTSRIITVGGREWQLEFLTTKKIVGGVESGLPVIVLLAGVTVSSLLFGMTYALSSAQVRAELIAAGMTSELEKFKRVVENTSEHVMITDKEGQILFANEAAQRTTGYSWTEMQGHTPRLWGKQMPAEFYKKMWHQIKDLKQTFEGELTNKHKNGERYPVWVSISPILGREGQVEYFVGVERDLTREKMAEVSLKQERDTARAIVDTMGEGLIVVDDTYRITRINPEAEGLLGVKSEEVEGQRWSDVIKAYEGDREIPFEKRTFTRVIGSGKTMVTELDADHYYVNRAGRKFPLVSVTAPFTERGIRGAVKVFKDATDEKESKSILRAQASGVLENAGEGIVLTDEKGRITFVNPAFERMTEYVNDEVAGKVFAESFRFYDTYEKLLSPVELADAAAVTARRQEVKVQVESKSGKKVAIVINAAPLRVGDEFRGVVRMIHDWSEDLALQRQKDDFFSIASHELRTPLAVISGNLDTVLAGYGGSKITAGDRQLLRDSETAGDRLISMVNNFLNVSRLDQGRVKITLKEVDGCGVVGGVAKEMKALAQQKGLRLTYVCKKGREKIRADENLLREIVVNLIGNSIKFTQKGGIKLEGGVKAGRLVVRLTDTGIGISAEKQKLLFQRWQQAMERTLSREGGGTGLGLYISREFARMMGGDLTLVRSSVSKGSVFELTLPIVKKGLAGTKKKAV